jgi:hypothetical protein
VKNIFSNGADYNFELFSQINARASWELQMSNSIIFLMPQVRKGIAMRGFNWSQQVTRDLF